MDRRNPVCRPLLTLEEALSWQPNNDDLCVARIPKRARKEQDAPKLLVCHDMKGGYLEDRLVQGCGKANSYRFFHWQYVDTFVYFSHYFVTIPPPGWTNTGHRHGVNVLGTVITEWDDGKARCEAFLQSEESYKQFADKLVQISKYYGFDGWLVNIENVIETEELVTNLKGFVKYLTEQQHEHVSGSQVIWYDSVVNTGKLDWQNALNDTNSLFFDVCDGIFLNYCWKETHLEMSKSNAITASRPYDVYVGIDVFGRGCLGDGGFNTCEALEAVRKHNLSAAIFAQGWVYETQGADSFTESENKFWHLLHNLCHPCCFTTLPLNTTFCQGFGERFFDNGIPVGNPWFNLNIQQLQPTFTQSQFVKKSIPDTEVHTPLSTDKTVVTSTGAASLLSPVTTKTGSLSPISPLTPDGKVSVLSPMSTPGTRMDWSMTATGPDEPEPVMEICTDDSFVGGSCLKLEADISNYNFVKYSLFSLDVELKQYASVYVSVTYKVLQDPDCDLFIELHLKHDDQSIVLVLVPFPDGDKPVPSYGRDTASMFVHPMNQEDLPTVLARSSPPSNNTRWKTRWFPVFNLYLKFCKLKLVNVGLTTTDPEPKKCIALLGDLKIVPVESVPETFPNVEFISAQSDTSTSYPLIEIGKNNFDSKCEETPKESGMVDWGVDTQGNPIQIPYTTLDEMRVSSHTLKEIRPGLGGQPCEVLYQLITSLDCFTLHWNVDCDHLIDNYRVYQIKIDSGVAKLLGHVTEPYFKVTWFEIPDYEKDELIHHFKFVIRAVLTNGVTVPLDYNYCRLFHIASQKDSVKLVKDASTLASDEKNENESVVSEKGDADEHSQPETDDCEGGNCDNEIVHKGTIEEKLEKLNTDGIENLTEKLNLSDE